MAKLNEDPARLEAALKVMTNQPKDHKVDVTVSKDANGAEKVTFDRPGTEHYLPSSQSFNVLSAGEEKGIKRIAKLMAGSQDTLPIDHLRALANAVKSYGSHGYDFDRGLTNFGYELSKNPATKSIYSGLAWSYDRGTPDESLTVYGRTSEGYFHTDGRITRKP